MAKFKSEDIKYNNKINFCIKDKTKKEFLALCEKKDETPSKILRQAINNYIRKNKED